MRGAFVAVLAALLALAICAARAQYAVMGLAFNETMSGYQIPGNLSSFEAAYAQGKAANDSIYFRIRSTIPSMEAFVANSSHEATVIGSIFAKGLTPTSGSPLGPGALLQIYDGGVTDGVMYLHYFLPFTGANGEALHLEGTKFVWGNECIHFLAEMTTLFIHVRSGGVRYAGDVLTTGIVTIPPAQVLALLASFAFVGNGTDADRLNTAILFAEFLEKNVAADCFNLSSYETNFWYVWFSDPQGGGGLLLDLIQKPTNLELRMEIYDPNQAPQVIKQYLPLSAMNVTSGELTMGPVTLTNTSCLGSVGNSSFKMAFTLGPRTNSFVPALLQRTALGLLPSFASTYGTLTNAVYGGGAQLASAPFVFSRYSIRFDLDILRWSMISAMSFAGTNLQIELLALDSMLDGLFLPSVYVYYRNTSHSFNDPFLLEARMHDAGRIAGAERVFSATIETLDLHLAVNCSAPLSQFALLDAEGNTQIHTTLLGACVATDVRAHASFVSKSALLEVKATTGSG